MGLLSSLALQALSLPVAAGSQAPGCPWGVLPESKAAEGYP